MADDIATLPDAVDAEDSTKQKPWEQFAQKKPWDLYSKAPAETKSATATPPPRFDTAQMSAYTPTLRQRASDAFHALRTSQPVETLLGRTDAEKAAVPALQSAPTTSDAGAMGLFTNKKQIIPRVDQPKTVMQGVQNLASEIADSIASPGGIALMAATGGGSAVATAEEQFAAKMAPVAKKLMDLGFRAQGVKMVFDAVRQNINNPNMTPGQLVENIGQALIGTGMAGRAFKGKIKPTTESESQNASKIASGEGVDLREQGAGVGTQAPLRQQGETAGTSEAPQEAQAGALALTPETPSEPVKDQNIGTTAPPETAAPSGAAPTIKNIGDKHGFTYDADFESGDIKLHQFTFRNLPKSDPAYGASFYAKQGATPEEVLKLANDKAEVFRAAKPPTQAAPTETPAPTEPTIKSPMSAFGKAFYKNTEGQWRQKGKPSASVNASTIDALEQLTKPKAAAQPEMVAMGGDVPHPRPQDFGTTGAPQDIYGVAERVRKARAAAGQVAPVPTGQGVSAEEAVKWGQDLIAMGADPEVSMREFERTRATSFDLISFTRAYGEQLAKSARSVEEKFGTDSIQYRTAQKALSDWDTRTKPIQTEWHKQGMAQQGETDIDTGSFTGINRAFREISGRDLNPAEAKTARKLAADVNEADKATEPAKAGLQTAIDGIAEKGTPVKVAADLESQRKAFGDYESGKPMTPLQVKTLWTRAKTEYIDKGNDSRPDIVHKLAIDLGLPVKDIMRGLEQTKPVRRAADDVWQRQRQARMLKEFAKNWVNHATETWLQKSLPTVARTLFTLKTGLHGTFALGTHAPLVVATHPIIFKNNFGRMYHLVLSPEYYEMQQHEIARRPNYTVAQRAGLVNDMSKMEDFSDPKLAQGFPKMAAWFKAKLDKAHLGRVVGMGTRGYSVLKILRQDLFDNAWNKLAESEKSPELAKAIADSVNHIAGVTKTGGGVVGKYAHYALFAPKLEASRVAVIATDPVRAVNSLLKMKNMTEAEKWFATNQFKEKASIFAVFTGLMLANQQLNELFGDKKKLNGVPVALGGGGWNPMQSDFGKFRVAGMTFAWGSPFLTMTRLPLRIYQIGAGSGGKTKYLIYPDESMYKTGGSYLRTQASPFISPVISVITKGDYADRPLPQMPGYGKPQPVPKRLAAEGVKPYTWKEFGTGIVLPIPFEEGANEVFHYYDLGQTKAAQNTLLRAFAITLIMAGTGGRMAEDWNKPKPRAANPAWSPPP
jgi:hypothetical protein